MSAKSRAILLLRQHRDAIARDISARIEALAPAFREVDLTARQQSVAAQIEACAALLSGTSKQQLITHLDQTIRLRTLAGVPPEAIFVASHCYLPTIRRVFVEQSPDALEGLRAYEVVEVVFLRIIGHLATLMANLLEGDESEEITSPEGWFATLVQEAR